MRTGRSAEAHDVVSVSTGAALPIRKKLGAPERGAFDDKKRSFSACCSRVASAMSAPSRHGRWPRRHPRHRLPRLTSCSRASGSPRPAVGRTSGENSLMSTPRRRSPRLSLDHNPARTRPVWCVPSARRLSLRRLRCRQPGPRSSLFADRDHQNSPALLHSTIMPISRPASAITRPGNSRHLKHHNSARAAA
jgi:hypothetical protein